MLKHLALAMLSLAAVSCAQTESASRVRLVSACDDYSGEARQRCLDEREREKPSPRALTGGRAAGAGGSHAPGGTGLGIGTMGADSTAEQGAVR